MAEWLYEAGIGEARAALVEDGAIVEARIEREGAGPRAGAVLEARLVRALPESGRALVRFGDAGEALLKAIPRGASEGSSLRIAITREAIPEPGNPKLPLARLATDDEPPALDGSSLLERLTAAGVPVRTLLSHEPDLLEAAGWSEVIEQAETGLIPFAGGLLRFSATPAMALFDVDGGLSAAELCIAGASAAARAIRLFDVTGSIGIDLPGRDKVARAAAASAIDAILPQPFERTAVNGFGFIQIVRPRLRASLPELLRADPSLTAALTLLRRAERAIGKGRRTLVAASSVIRRIEREQRWRAELARRAGVAIDLREERGIAISAGHVEVEHPR